MHELRCRRIYGTAGDDDGFRVLVDRLWPRGMKKDSAQIDHWAKEVAPSTELRKWFGHAPEKYAEFSAMYVAELERNPEAEAFRTEIRERLKAGNVTLLYAAKDETCNHAAVLKSWLEE